MSDALILVTGATGKTGAPVVQQLIERGFPVRALVRRLDERATRLEQLGAEVVVGDFMELASMRRAMDGVERVYFVYPPQGDKLVEATAIVASAAKDAASKQSKYTKAIECYKQALSIKDSPAIHRAVDTCNQNIAISQENQQVDSAEAQQEAEIKAEEERVAEEERKAEEWEAKQDDD